MKMFSLCLDLNCSIPNDSNRPNIIYQIKLLFFHQIAQILLLFLINLWKKRHSLK